MMRKINLITLFFAMIINVPLFSMDPQGFSGLRFKSFTVEDGLKTNSVYDIFQDSRGLLWFGTQDGVNLYDGRKFSVIGDNSALSSGAVFSITEDTEGDILLSSTSGLYRYRVKTEKLEPYHELLTSHEVHRVLALENDSLIISFVNRGLYLFEKDELIPLIQNLKVNDLTFLDDIVYAATDNGIILYNLHSRETEEILLEGRGVLSLKNKEDEIWAGSDHGLYSINPSDRSSVQKLKEDVAVTAIAEDSKSRIWTGTGSNGLIQYDNQFNRNRSFRDDKTILSLYLDRSDNLWIGYLGSGLKKIDIHRVGFSYLGTAEGLENTIVVSLWEDEDQSLWIGTFGGGLYHYSRNGILLGQYAADPDDPDYPGDNRIMGLFRDSRDRLWIGTKSKGLFFLQNGTFMAVPGSFSSIYTIGEDKKGRIWAITQGGGIHILNTEGDIERTLTLPAVPTLSYRTMLIRDDHVYLGSVDSGLIVLDLDGKIIRHYSPESETRHGLKGAHVISLLFTEDGDFWAGTYGGGLYRYDAPGDTFLRITTEDGLPNNTVYGILEDRSGRLWVSTNRGLALIQADTLDITVFTRADGLQSNEFNSGASLRGRNGSIYMGGVLGLSYFDPDMISRNTRVPRTILTDLSINNKKITVGEEHKNRILLPQSLVYTDEIRLSREDLVVSFQFSSLHFSEPENNSYAYYLEGLEPDWNYSGNISSSTYTNLPPGEYRFRYKSASSEGIWSDEQSVGLVVVPEIYQTLTFKIILVALILSLLLLMIRVRIVKAESKNTILEERVRERTEELEQALVRERRMRDFLSVGEKMSSIVTLTARLAHNINTPLGSSLTALSFLKTSLENSNADPLLIDSCNVALEGTNKTVQIVKQLSSASSTQALPTPILFNLSEILNEYLGQYWKLVLQKKGFHILMDLPETESTVLGSISALQETMDCLIGNTIEHGYPPSETDSTVEKRISMKLVYSEKEALIIYRDNGKGIDEESRRKIFEPYEGKSDTQKSGSGGMGLFFVYNLIKMQFKGSITCIQKNDGACFHIKIPISSEKKIL